MTLHAQMAINSRFTTVPLTFLSDKLWILFQCFLFLWTVYFHLRVRKIRYFPRQVSIVVLPKSVKKFPTLNIFIDILVTTIENCVSMFKHLLLLFSLWIQKKFTYTPNKLFLLSLHSFWRKYDVTKIWNCRLTCFCFPDFLYGL